MWPRGHVTHLVLPAGDVQQPHPLAQVVLQRPGDAAALIGLRRLARLAERHRAQQSLAGHLDQIIPLHQRMRPTSDAAGRAEACGWRRDGESGAAIGGTALNPTPNGRPDRCGKDAPPRQGLKEPQA